MSKVTRRTTFVPAPSRAWPKLFLACVGGLLCVSLGLILTAGTPTPSPGPAPVSLPAAVAEPVGPITIAAVGDSITSWDASDPIKNTWPTYLTTGTIVVDQTDGWALPYMRLADMAAHVTPIHSDYLVVMGGVNDIAHDDSVTPQDQMVASLEQIVAESGVPADRVVISYIAPLVTERVRVAAWNTEEQALCDEHGWTCVDPWVGLRDASGIYLPQYTVEGLHPNAAGSQMVASAIAAEVFLLGSPIHHFVTLPAAMTAPVSPALGIAAAPVTVAQAPVVRDGNAALIARLVDLGVIR